MSELLEMEPVEIEDLKKDVRVPRADFELWLEKLNWTYHQIARGEFPSVMFRNYFTEKVQMERPFKSLAEFQMACFCNDPVLWIQAFLREPEDPDHLDPYSLWDYQKEALRYRHGKIYDCGSETGKSRDISIDNLFCAFTTPNGSGLNAAPQQTHLDEIIEAMYDQFCWNKDLTSSLKHWRKHPHHTFYLDNGFKIYFRPAGHDGEAFRSVHVRTFAKIDEAAKMKNPKQWSEFWRALKPGCVPAVYSVTDGDRSCEFYRLKQRSKLKAEGKPSTQPGEQAEDALKNAPSHIKNYDFKHFKWAKTMMPPPYWSEERKKFFIELYGGEDSPGYKHNVLAEDGDPENSVFPWYQFQRLLKDIPDYRCLKIMIDDSQGEVSILGTKYTGEGDISKPQEIILCNHAISKANFDIRTEIKSFFSNIAGLKFLGADLGFSQDPTEIYIKLIIGKTHRLIARVQLKGVSYDQQAEAIDALDDIFDSGEHKMGLGLDFGNAGSAVCHILQNQALYFDKRFEDRLTGFQFGATYEAVNEEGDIIMDKFTEKPVKLTAKELATDLLVKKMQRQELEYPFDPDLILFYPNHTYREGERHRIYKKEDDHIIDADRCLTLRVILPGEGSDQFASGSYKR